jgi:putative ABC transport system substrate-binding protein
MAIGLAGTLEARSQLQHGPLKVGIIFSTVPRADMTGVDPINPYARAFVHGLRARGYAEGPDLILERRSAEGRSERMQGLVEELVSLPVDVIVTSSTGATAAARATRNIPIVANIDDPVGLGLTDSLSRPSRNVTGLTDSPDLTIHSKRLQLLKEIAPRATRVAVIDFKYIDSRATPGAHLRRRELEAAARRLGLSIVPVEADNIDELARALARSAEQRPDSMIEVGAPVALAGRQAIAEFAARERLPAVYSAREFTEAGGLLAYGTDIPALFERLAEYVGKLLKGTKVSDLPFEHPTKFELVVNMKAARDLGLEVPRSLLLRASDIIQ